MGTVTDEMTTTVVSTQAPKTVTSISTAPAGPPQTVEETETLPASTITKHKTVTDDVTITEVSSAPGTTFYTTDVQAKPTTITESAPTVYVNETAKPSTVYATSYKTEYATTTDVQSQTCGTRTVTVTASASKAYGGGKGWGDEGKGGDKGHEGEKGGDKGGWDGKAAETSSKGW